MDRTKAANLTNDVHPLLAKDKFSDYVVYDTVFLQPARLATRMLSTPQAQHYFQALVINSKHISDLQGAARYQRYRCQPYKNIQDLDPRDRRHVENWLLRIADCVSYEVRECPRGGLGTSTAYKLDDGVLLEACLGHSVIRISRSKHYDPLRKDLSARERLTLQFDLAITLLHELAHAANYAITGKPLEDFFENSIVAEAGFEFTSRLFGLVPTSIGSSPLVLGWFSWPSRALLPGYDLTKLCCDQSKLKDGYTAGEVEVGFMENLFQVECWENTVASVGSSALLAPPILTSSSDTEARSTLDLIAMDRQNTNLAEAEAKARSDGHKVRKELRRRVERLEARIKSSNRTIAKEIRARTSAQAELASVVRALATQKD